MVSSQYMGRPSSGSSTALLDLLTKVGSAADLPASVLRDLLGGQGLAGSFDQLLTPLSPENRLTGNDLLQQIGIDGGMLGGMATEALLDPMILAGGLGMVARGAAGAKPFSTAHNKLRQLAKGVGPQYDTALSQIGLPRREGLAPLLPAEHARQVRDFLTPFAPGGTSGARQRELLSNIPPGSQIMENVDAGTLRIMAPGVPGPNRMRPPAVPPRELRLGIGDQPLVPGVTREPQGTVTSFGDPNYLALMGPESTMADMGPWKDITHDVRMPNEILAENPLRGPDSLDAPIHAARAFNRPEGFVDALNYAEHDLVGRGLIDAAGEADAQHLTRATVGGYEPGDPVYMNRMNMDDFLTASEEGIRGTPRAGLLQQMNEELALRGQGRVTDAGTLFEWDPNIPDYNQPARAGEAPFEATALNQSIPPLAIRGTRPGRPVNYLQGRQAHIRGETNMRMANQAGFPIGGDWPTNRYSELQNATQPRAEHAQQLSEVLMRSTAGFPEGRQSAGVAQGFPGKRRQAIPTKEEILQRFAPRPEESAVLSDLLDAGATPGPAPSEIALGPAEDWVLERGATPLAQKLVRTRQSVDQLAKNIESSGLQDVDIWQNFNAWPGTDPLDPGYQGVPMIDNLLAGNVPLRNAGRPGRAVPNMPIDQYAREAMQNWDQLTPLQKTLMKTLGYLKPARGMGEALPTQYVDMLDQSLLPASLAALTGGGTAQAFSRGRREGPRLQSQRQY